MTAQQPWRIGGSRRLASADYLSHLDDLVRTVLLTGPSERLHRPGFGAGLAPATLFEPLSEAISATVVARARGSLADALGDRIDVMDVAVTIAGSTLSAQVTYRPRPAGASRTVLLTLPGSAP
jgi:phage baseplate assembly protein W